MGVVILDSEKQSIMKLTCENNYASIRVEGMKNAVWP